MLTFRIYPFCKQKCCTLKIHDIQYFNMFSYIYVFLQKRKFSESELYLEHFEKKQIAEIDIPNYFCLLQLFIFFLTFGKTRVTRN